MSLLQDILYKVHLEQVIGSTNIEVTNVQLDSRKVESGGLFVAIKGAISDGHDFIGKAISLGATSIVCEDMPAEIKENVTYVQVKNSHEALGYIANNFYDNPSQKIKLVGVTGTNGKTTIATLLYKLFTGLNYKCGLVSTVQNIIGTKALAAERTTPDAVSLCALIKQMVDEGCQYVFMESSSIAIDQDRITGLDFDGALFSNLTLDHLDYHKTFDNYLKAKKKFFDELPAHAFAITNIDDKNGGVMLQNTVAKKYTYSLKTLADFKGRILENSLTGLEMLINETEVHFRLIGEFNAYNLLAVYGAAVCLGEPKDEVLRVLSMLSGAEGRFDYHVSSSKIISIVDYAHTPDALENVLSTIKKLRKGSEKVITVVGCGGDRDHSKRPIMAQDAANQSDQVILTSDNPRSENPYTILKEMEAGLNSAGKRKTITIEDRKEAIKAAVKFANPGDIILVAGKGHEKYQEINGVKHHFDDKEVLKEMFELLEK
ncbi:UDP-N-acetylmuramoyl-L-alanyl-D-glutamate--2,6-diaminopimelate ligase [Rhizosphaericola mali]|uniref:UDP-N-acetylmuramoyl-L-alanyl-D-glutamate--2,6-diaminopimelate ligase n=1 Tax=Rhizosphaericola mali TaxID=2545455 RepID=A0A5P2GGJ3_9BACT|nr:UDP-N-acetylmuramoyl-L-alanyl-D-glutamate--2,6-diaminopimelate ligase [Rhizosphaericola mali]QES90871.1 UDP-N-acetylmuramoyl-L-alanyl-D-glutamate--2,6-diaminopimelate ligase [Rhizosphaericola mali]